MNKYREEMSRRACDLQSEAGRQIFSLATGALALSITFRSSLVPDKSTHLWYLKACWIALLISIMAHVIGLLLESWVWSDILSKTNYKLNGKRRFALAIPAFFTTAGFSMGMICLAIFALANLK